MYLTEDTFRLNKILVMLMADMRRWGVVLLQFAGNQAPTIWHKRYMYDDLDDSNAHTAILFLVL